MKKTALSVGDKILAAMHELSQGSTKPLKYEDIVVAAWKKFPQDFSLRGHEYPDSSDIHKPLYGPLKSKGFVRTANKFFSLTEHGLAYIERILQKVGNAKSTMTQTKRLGRDEQAEAEKLLQSDAFKLYESGEKDKILDSDIYAFYGVTVRTGKNEGVFFKSSEWFFVKNGRGKRAVIFQFSPVPKFRNLHYFNVRSSDVDS